ncbi:uncharacterized protein PFL1_03155 [Pseudozyma flocculosa PF-1]|nr:uncharacterized protein PFL1_03155 [Pseudozyma flocculosa PF-1]EPQ29400.1 hypothetical protein PFL1_03155 [Pseudozyma flocculosa PF-1]
MAASFAGAASVDTGRLEVVKRTSSGLKGMPAVTGSASGWSLDDSSDRGADADVWDLAVGALTGVNNFGNLDAVDDLWTAIYNVWTFLLNDMWLSLKRPKNPDPKRAHEGVAVCSHGDSYFYTDSDKDKDTSWKHARKYTFFNVRYHSGKHDKTVSMDFDCFYMVDNGLHYITEHTPHIMISESSNCHLDGSSFDVYCS